MTVEYSPLKMAMEMMRSALVLIDEAGETHAALNLQHAISILAREPVPRGEFREQSVDLRDA